jgi:hypothetical protein
MGQNRMDRAGFLANGQDRISVFHRIYLASRRASVGWSSNATTLYRPPSGA